MTSSFNFFWYDPLEHIDKKNLKINLIRIYIKIKCLKEPLNKKDYLELSFLFKKHFEKDFSLISFFDKFCWSNILFLNEFSFLFSFKLLSWISDLETIYKSVLRASAFETRPEQKRHKADLEKGFCVVMRIKKFFFY